jgi:hypothetical protein
MYSWRRKTKSAQLRLFNVFSLNIERNEARLGVDEADASDEEGQLEAELVGLLLPLHVVEADESDASTEDVEPFWLFLWFFVIL